MYAMKNPIIFIISLFLSLKCYSNDTKYFLSELEEPLPTATITSIHQLICDGETATIEIALTGRGPWDLTYSDDLGNVKTITGITDSIYTLRVSPAFSTLFFITEVKDQNAVNGEDSSPIWVFVSPRPVFIRTIHASELKSAGQDIIIEQVCVGATRNYRVEGEQGSVYTWELYNTSDIKINIPNQAGRSFSATDPDGDTHYMNEVTIQWNNAGVLKLKVIQQSLNNCETTNQGFIEVFEQPTVWAGNPLSICAAEKIYLTSSDANHYSSLLWTTSGDGYFDEPTALHTAYNSGPNDLITGSVKLTLTAFGKGNPNTCAPATSTLVATFRVIPNLVINEPAPVCAPAAIDLSLASVTLGSDPDVDNFEYFADLMATIPLLNYKTIDRAGTYYIRGTNAAGCSVIQPVNVTFNKLIVPNFASISDVCLNSIQQLPASNFNGISGHWEPSAIVNTTTEGEFSYTFKVYPGQCAKDTTIAIRVAKPVTPNFSLSNELCQGSVPFVLPTTSIEGISGTWLPAVIETNQLGSKSYIFTPSAGQCVQYKVESIRIIEKITPTFNVIGPFCFGSSPQALPTTSANGIAGTWSPSAIATNKSGISIYTYTPDDDCAVPVTIPIEIYEPITVDVKFAPLSILGGKTQVTVTATGGTGFYSSGTGVFDYSSGTYIFTVTDNAGCESSPKTIYISEPQQFDVEAKILAAAPCFGGNALIQAKSSGGKPKYKYTLTGGKTPYSYMNDSTFYISASDIPYQFEVIDAEGKFAQSNILEVTQPPKIELTASGTETSCAGMADGTATVEPKFGQAPYFYKWDNEQTTATATGLSAGTHWVTVWDQLDCYRVTIDVVVSDPSVKTLQASATDPKCHGEAGTILFTFTNVPDGTYNILYDGNQFSNVQVTSNTTSVQAMPGTYNNLKLVINGCSTANGINATVNPTPAVPPAQALSVVSVENPKCFGDVFTINLSMTTTISSGNYTFFYDGGTFDNIPVVNNKATITGVITESSKDFNNLRFIANGCTSTGNVNIRIESPAELEIRIVKILKQSLKGAIDIVASGGTGSYKYTWSNGATTEDLTEIPFGNYTVTVSDDKNCTTFKEIQMPLNNPPVANAGTDQIINEGETVSLDGTSSYEVDGEYMTIKWTAPIGITLSSTTIFTPTFTAPEVKKDSTLNFSLVVNDGLVNSMPSTVKITVLNVIKVGIPEHESAVFKVYPNPTTGIINLEFSGEIGNDAEILVTNLLGVKVFRKEITDENKYQIDISNQLNGIYLLKIITDNQEYNNKTILRKD
ncbi:MAG TPA: hypothetical protein DHV48_17840 [Prolixibacteraceae bacterium]|nr:hypothetical protein [Prolixibacteraceae bacterium]